MSEILWKDRKRIFGLPISFTKYVVTNNKIFLINGLFTTSEEEILLYRVLDLSLKRTLGDKILGVGTVKITSADENARILYLENIKYPLEVRDMLSELVEAERDRIGILGRELVGISSENIKDK